MQAAANIGETRQEDQAALFSALGNQLAGKPKVSSYAKDTRTVDSSLLQRAAAEYRRAVDAHDKDRMIQVLSMFRAIGRKLTRSVCNEEYFSSDSNNKYHISAYFWQWGGRWLSEEGLAGHRDERAIQFQETHKRLDVEEILRVVQFLSMDTNLQHWAYGVRHYIMANGDLRTVPKCTAKLPAKDLLSQYNKECTLRGDPEVCESDFYLALKILNGNSTDLLATALDPIRVKDGIDNFRAMRRFVQDVAINQEVQAAMISQIDQVEVYLRTEFTLHLSEHSTTAVHAYSHTFADGPIQVSVE